MPALKNTDMPKPTVSKTYASPSSPYQILKETFEGMQTRQRNLLNKHKLTLSHYPSLLRSIEKAVSLSPLSLFYLTHSSFEYALDQLQHEKNEKTLEASKLVKNIHIQVETACSAEQPLATRFFEVSNNYDDTSIFPDPQIHQETTNEDSLLVEDAKKIISHWEPALIAEIDFFIPNYAFWNIAPAPFSAQSLPYSPGHVTLAKKGLYANNHLNTDTKAIILAACLIHESRHQKGYFFNRALDPRPNLFPTPFIKDGYENLGSSLLLDHPVQNMLDILLSVSYEYLFWNFALENYPVDEYRELLIRDRDEKKGHVMNVLTCAELNREILTPLGETTLNSIINFWNEKNDGD